MALITNFTMPPYPAVLQFPGVPQLTGGFGASIGLGSGGLSVGVAAGAATGLGSLAGNLGGTVTLGPGGVSAALSGSLSGGLSPYALSLASGLPPLLTADQPGGMFQGPTWGIYDLDGESIAPWESVLKVDYRREFRIADFPIEAGRFASYNKVQMPYDMRISFMVGSRGGAPQRTQLLASLEAAVASLDFYTVVTPEATYRRANLTHMEYRRESQRGVNLLVVDVFVSEVRPASASTYTTTPKSPTAQGAGNNGQTQPIQVPTVSVPPTSQSGVGGLGLPHDFSQPQDPTMPTLGAGSTLPGGGVAALSPVPALMPSQAAPTVPTELTATPGFGTIF